MFNLEETQLRIALPWHSAPRSALVRYGSVTLATALAAVLTYLLWPSINPAVSLLFFVSVLFSAWYGGLKPALLSCLLSTAVCNLFFVAPMGSIRLGTDDLLRLAVFMTAAVFVSSINLARELAETAAAEAKKRLAVTLRSIGDAVITTDARGRVTFMNSVAQSLTGWDLKEARGREIDDIFRIVDRTTKTEVDTVVSRVLKENVVFGLGNPALMVTRDLTEVPVDQIAVPDRDSEGQLKGVVLVLRDAADRVSPETERDRVLKATSSLLEAVDANMFAIDLEGRCFFANKLAADLLGYRAEEISGKDIHDFIHSPDNDLSDHDDDECAVCYAIRAQNNLRLSVETMWRRDDSTIPVEFSSAPIMLGEERLGSVITISDLTEHQRAEEALAKLSCVMGAVEEAIVTHTTDGVITGWSQKAESILGFTEDEVIGRHVSIIHPPGRNKELTDLFRKVGSKEHIDGLETVRIRKGGTQVPVSIAARPIIGSTGNVETISLILRDLTMEKRLAEAEAWPGEESRNTGSWSAVRSSEKPAAPQPESNGNRHAQAAPMFAGVRNNGRMSASLVGSSAEIQQVLSTIERVAPSESSVLITGATGTGKELVARAIHQKSLRAGGPFVDINCSAIPETLIEAELFGHQRGTFTGAHENRPGLFEIASGGTLFLDEVDALPLAAQAKLLRVLQERRVRRVGGRTNIKVDVRIISATNSDLSTAISENRFRSDLFYRLRVFPLHVPELCHRKGDVEQLIEHFLRRGSERNGAEMRRFEAQAMEILLAYPWPGNVRELENAVEYALAIGTGSQLRVEDLPPEIVRGQEEQVEADLKQVLQAFMNDSVPLAEIEKRYILSVLQQFGGNQVQAAAALGIDRSKLYRRLRHYGIKAVKFLQEEQLDGLQFRGGRAEELTEH